MNQIVNQECNINTVRIAVIGLGYVGLPLALAFAKQFSGTIGFDINPHKAASILRGVDPSGEACEEEIRISNLAISSNIEELRASNFFIVAVPTPVDRDNRPDLSFVIAASKSLGQIIKLGDTVVFESTVYPGVTEEICGQEIARESKLISGKDFKLGYSPERINPGDSEHSLEKVVKIISGQDLETVELIASVYGKVVHAGLYRASSIRVAEAAKVVENTQRDLNIALMNELAIVFDRMNVKTSDVLRAAETKWNFLKFSPGLVGGHCIGIDPYYLTSRSEQLGYVPEVILAGRVVNNEMGHFIAQKTIKLMAKLDIQITKARVGIIGLAFKENVSDIRNSRVPSIVAELKSFNIHVMLYDAKADPVIAKDEYNLTISSWEELCDLDALILAVPHADILSRPREELWSKLRARSIFVDVKSSIPENEVPGRIKYWSL